jgi:rsbT co-antagonist protein RsbR
MDDLLFQKTLLECLSNTATEGFLVVSDDQRWLSVNRRFIEMWGLPDDVVASSAYQAALTAMADQVVDPERFLAQIASLHEDQDDTSRDEIELKDGRFFDRSSAPVTSADGHYYGRIWYYRDISDCKRAAAALRESEEKFRQIAEHTREVFWMTDRLCSRFIYISPSYQEVWGRTRLSLYQQPETFLDAIHIEDREQVLAARERMMAGEYSEEYRIVRPDGAIRWVQSRGHPVKNDAGEVYRVVGFTEDITERKRAEEEQRRLQDEQRRLQDEIIQMQAATLAELSTPLIPISDRVVVMPLIGAVDSERAQLVMETLLRGVAESKAEVAILDITGVPVVDTLVANGLIGAARAAQLLGAQVLLTGIRPEVAQTLVGLGADLGGIVTLSTLQSGIAFAIGRRSSGNHR